MHFFSKFKIPVSILEVLYVFLATRIPLIILTILFMGFTDSVKYVTISQAFSQWDGRWYLSIAREGYHWMGPSIQANVAFFPMYPLVGKLLNFIIGNFESSLIIVSYVSFFIFLIFTYKISRMKFGRSISFRSIWYLSIFPLSFVFSVIYSESLFLAFITGSFYFAYKGRWKISILLGILSSITRIAGLVMLPTLLYIYLKTHKRYKVSQILGIFTMPIGVILFSTYLWYKVGDFLAFYHVLNAWNILYQDPFKTILFTLGFIGSLPKYHYFVALGTFDLTLFTLFTILLILSYKRLPKELFLYSLLIYIFSVSKSWDPKFFYPFGSTNRYLLAAFPLFFTLAKLGKNKLFDLVYTVLSIMFLSILSLSFYSGKWVF